MSEKKKVMIQKKISLNRNGHQIDINRVDSEVKICIKKPEKKGPQYINFSIEEASLLKDALNSILSNSNSNRVRRPQTVANRIAKRQLTPFPPRFF